MSDQSAAFEQLRFATSDLPVAERWPTFLDMGRTVAKVDCMPLEDDFFVDGSFCKLPAAGVGSFSSSALRATRSRAMADCSDDLIFYMSIEGTANIAHLGREATVSAGESILVTSADPLRMDRSRIRYIHATIPRSVLAPALGDFDAALMRPMPGTGEAIRLLRGYLGLLAATPSLQGSDIGGLASAHVTDLIATAVGATREAAEIAAGRGVRAVRLRAIKADIDSNLAGGDVGSDALARRHRVSPRYVRKLFEGEGTSLSQFVLGRRLAQVHRALCDPRLALHSISAIAFGTGFGDLSTFNHAFRRQFGMTPSEARAVALDRNGHTAGLSDGVSKMSGHLRAVG